MNILFVQLPVLANKRYCCEAHLSCVKTLAPYSSYGLNRQGFETLLTVPNKRMCPSMKKHRTVVNVCQGLS